MKSPLITAFFLLILSSLFYFFLDQKLLFLILTFSADYTLLLKLASFLIYPPLYVAFSIGGFLFAYMKKSPLSAPLFEIATAQCFSAVFVKLLKILSGRARPDLLIKKGIYGFFGPNWDHNFHSFPSGHAIMAFTLATSLSYLIPRYRILFFLAASILSLTRPLLLDHFFSDVIAAAAIGLLIGNVVHLILSKFKNQPGNKYHETL